MAAIHDLIAQVGDVRLRDRLSTEWVKASQNKRFGLVFEDHMPELMPLYDAKPVAGSLVCLKGGTIKEVWQVIDIENGLARCVKPQDSTYPSERGPLKSVAYTYKTNELLVVREFGQPIFPALIPVDAVANGPTGSPWHTLIEADNYHALQLLDYLYAGRVDCIYIDPPYNTGSRDWKYNNDYVDGNDAWRHSKWLAFMERRLKIAKRLLKPDIGVLIVTIDEHEVHHLGMLLESHFPDAYRQLVTIVINQKGVAQERLSRVEEYAIYCFNSEASVPSYYDDLLSPDRSNEKRFQTPRWEWLQRGGNNATPALRHGLFYPIFVDPETKQIVEVGKPLPKGTLPDSEQLGKPNIAWPIRRDGSYATWQVGPETLKGLVEKGFVRLGGHDKKRKTWTIQYLGKKALRQIKENILKVVWMDETRGCVEIEYTHSEQRSLKTVWHRQTHDSGVYGSSLLKSVLKRDGSFSFPKSLYATRDAVAAVVRDRPEALVLDFFAGSGTTLNAINLLNVSDGGKRRCILVTNNEVSASEAESLRLDGAKPGDPAWEAVGICRSVTWPRSKYTILGKRDDGSALTGEYFTGKMLEKPKRRRFVHVGFLASGSLDTVAKQKQFIGLIEGLPQTAIRSYTPFVLVEGNKTTVLFNVSKADQWLEALSEHDQISVVYIVTPDKAVFDDLKWQVDAALGSLTSFEDEKKAIGDGFPTNLAYFRLSFLDKDNVALRKAFRQILPLLWLKSGAVGRCPELKAKAAEPDILVPEASNFAVLLNEGQMGKLLKALVGRKDLSTIYIVTDADEAFRDIAQEVRNVLSKANPEIAIVQLYRDYLKNFLINKQQQRRTDTTVSDGE